MVIRYMVSWDIALVVNKIYTQSMFDVDLFYKDDI